MIRFHALSYCDDRDDLKKPSYLRVGRPQTSSPSALFAEFETRVVGSPRDNGWFTEKPFATARSQQPAASSFRAATPVRVSEA